jgi:hypothetical protein
VFHGEKSGLVETSMRPSHLMLAIPTQAGDDQRHREAVIGRERNAVHLVGEEDVVERRLDRERAPHPAQVEPARDDVGVEALREHVDRKLSDPCPLPPRRPSRSGRSAASRIARRPALRGAL